MKTISILTAALLASMSAGAAPVIVVPFERRADPTPRSEIDQLVFNRLDQLEIQPANLSSDAVFLRRAYLDVIGTLPTEDEARAFLRERNRNKRRVLIDELLQREEFADYWAMKWSDLLRVKAEFPINLWPNAAQAYHRWIRTSIRDNTPYDRFVREMLTSSGSNFRTPQVNFYRAVQNNEPADLAQAVALAFMGARAENWPEERLAGMAGFFARIGFKDTMEWKEEIVFFDLEKPLVTAIFPDGTIASMAPERDPREVFADWLIAPDNPWLARNIVNRIWSWLLGRGIIHEPDDIRSDNPPSHPELLAYLEKELVSSGYDLRHIFRLILNSNSYQLSSIPQTDHPGGAANFAYYSVRRLDAEVLIDALNQITGTTEKYVSPIPEPFTFLPEDQRAVALPDGSISSPFLEMFGSPSRDTGLESERNNAVTAGQRLHLLNSTHVQSKIEASPRLREFMQSRNRPRQAIEGVYLTVLSRFPTEDEMRIVAAHLESSGANRRAAAFDLVWALINSPEFLYRH